MKKIITLLLALAGMVSTASAAKLYVNIDNVSWWSTLRVFAENSTKNNAWNGSDALNDGIISTPVTRFGKTWYAYDMGDYDKAQVQQGATVEGKFKIYNITYAITGLGSVDKYVIITGEGGDSWTNDNGESKKKYNYGYYEAPAYRGNGTIGWSVEASNMTVKDANTVTIDLPKDYVDAITGGEEIRFRIYNFGNQLYPNTSGTKVNIASGGITDIANGSSDNYFSIDNPAYDYDHITVTVAYSTSTPYWTVSADAYISKTANGTNAEASLGYSTFGAETDVDLSSLPTGVTAQIATVDATGKITYSTATELAAGEGVLLTNTTGANATLSIPVKASAASVSSNALRRVTSKDLAQSDGEYTHYILSEVSGNLGWYKVHPAGCNNLTVGTAYLRVNKSTPDPSRGFFTLWSDEPTDVKAVNTIPQTTENVYDLQGRRVTNPVKGLYIVNGKKVMY